MKVIFIVILCFSGISIGRDMDNRKKDIQELIDSVLPLAKLLLAEQGEFLPFGFVMKTDGEIISVSAKNDDEYPSSKDIINILRESFFASASKEKYKATAIAYNVTLNNSDAIAIDLDYLTGYSVTLFVQYTKENVGYSYGELKLKNGNKLIFK